jgi:hypothetical protein
VREQIPHHGAADLFVDIQSDELGATVGSAHCARSLEYSRQ